MLYASVSLALFPSLTRSLAVTTSATQIRIALTDRCVKATGVWRSLTLATLLLVGPAPPASQTGLEIQSAIAFLV